MSIYDKRATTQSSGLLDLGNITSPISQGTKQLEAGAEKTRDLAKETYLNSSTSEARRLMGELFVQHKSNPSKLIKEFSNLKDTIGSEIGMDDAKLSYMVDFEIAAAPYIRSAKDAYDKRQASMYTNSIKEELRNIDKNLMDNSMLEQYDVTEENKDAYASRQILKEKRRRLLNEKDPLTGKPIFSDKKRDDGEKFLNDDLKTVGVMQRLTDFIDNGEIDEGIAWSNDVINTSANEMGVDRETKKKMDGIAKDFLDNPKINGEAVKAKVAIGEQYNGVINSVKDGAMSKQEGIEALMGYSQQLEAGLNAGKFRSDDTGVIKLKTQMDQAIGRNVLEGSARKDTKWFGKDNGSYLQDEVANISSGNTQEAASLYKRATALANKQGVSLNDSSQDGKNKINKILKQVNRESLDNSTGVKYIDETPNMVLTIDGKLSEYDSNAPASGGFTIGEIK